jgi:hypothetical protein
VIVVPEPKGKRRGKATAPPATNGKPLSKGKGRAASTANGHKSSEPTIVDLDDDEPSVARPPPPTKKGKTRAGSSHFVEEGETIETESAASPELERMREERDLVRPLSAPVQADY